MNDQRPGVHFTHPWRLAIAVVVSWLVVLLMGVGAMTIWRWLT